MCFILGFITPISIIGLYLWYLSIHDGREWEEE